MNKPVWVPKTNYQMMWDTLGVEQHPKQRPNNYGHWPKVMAVGKDNQVIIQSANEVMAHHGFALDNGVIPAGAGFGNGVNINQINSLAIDNVFLGWGELSLLQQNCIINNICTIIADAMTEKWIKFRSNNKSKQKKIVELEKAVAKYNLKELMNIAVQRTILLGTAYVSPKLKNDELDLKEELILDSTKIGKGDLEEIFVIEPTWVVPIEFNMINPRAKNFYKPQAYVVFGDTIHASRMRRLMYIEPVNLISPMYLFGGQPLIQTLLPYILDFLNTKKQVVQIISRYNISVLQTNMSALKGKDQYGATTTAAGSVRGRAATFNAMRNNFGLFLLDEKEQFTQIQISLTGLTDILQQQAELLSLFTRIPVAKLFGQAPRGMNATGEYDANNFNELIFSMQESKLRPILDYCIGLIQLSTFGDIDKEIEFDFEPLGDLNEKDQSIIKDGKVNRAAVIANSGMADPVALMDVLVNDPDLGLSDYKQPADFDIAGTDPNDNTETE